MRTIKTYRKVGAFYIAWEADFATSRTKSDGARTLPVINPRQTEDLFIGSRRTINRDR
jgi:hypothetical protein